MDWIWKMGEMEELQQLIGLQLRQLDGWQYIYYVKTN